MKEVFSGVAFGAALLFLLAVAFGGCDAHARGFSGGGGRSFSAPRVSTPTYRPMTTPTVRPPTTPSAPVAKPSTPAPTTTTSSPVPRPVAPSPSPAPAAPAPSSSGSSWMPLWMGALLGYTVSNATHDAPKAAEAPKQTEAPKKEVPPLP
jgi:hypothetical protein